MAGTAERLIILSDREIEEIYGLPRFTHEERVQYFSLTPEEHMALDTLHSVKSKAYCILQLGYFRARHQFPHLTPKVIREDLAYVLERHFPGSFLPDIEVPDQRTQRKHRSIILGLYRFRHCGGPEKQSLKEKAQQAVRLSGKPLYVFRVLMDHVLEMRVVLPSYRFMQDTVSHALAQERIRLGKVLNQHMGLSETDALNALLENTGQVYEITQLKRQPREYNLGEIKQEIHWGEQIAPLYQLAQKVLPALQLSNEGIKYYASLVGYYSVYKLKRLHQRDIHLYLLCFVYHRYQQIHDNLIGCLIYHVRQYLDAAKEAARERVTTHRNEVNENLPKAGRVLGLFTEDDIPEDATFRDVQGQAFAILERDKLAETAEYIATKATFDEKSFQWEHIDKLAKQFKQRLRPVLLSVDVAAANTKSPLIEAIHFLEEAFQKKKPLSQYAPEVFPMRCVSKETKRYLYAKAEDGTKRFLPDRYEFLIYRLLRDRLEAGDIFCQDSVRFRSFEDDLVDDAAWENKEQLIADTGLAILKQPVREHLADLKQLLETRITEVNARIASGENEHFKVTKQGKSPRWTLRYPKESDPVNHPFFNALPQVDISRVLHFVHRQCGFMEAFEHVLGRYVKSDANTRLLTACLVAWGTNMGLGKMGSISDIGYQVLAGTSENFLRLETLKAANDLIGNATAGLSIFRHYDIGEVVHSSSDGQKFETRIHTLKSRHSPKYFGLKKGITSYTLTANHVPINATIFGANEHESHYVFDLLYNNATDIQPDIHSTDTHGSNEVNFAILHIFGHQFAPRYRDICDTVTKSLYGFQHPSQYEDCILKPVRKINQDWITEEWENQQRIMVSLAYKATTQSIIIGKLSAHARKNKTKRALWEYDNIIRSLYLLDYVDSPPLRRQVQKALNRTESYHKLRRAIAIANGGKLQFRTETEQEIWNECSRLIANCIIHYNATILSNLLTHYESIGDTENAERIKQISPVAWQHINLYGRYEFQKKTDPINLSEIIRKIVGEKNTPLPMQETT